MMANLNVSRRFPMMRYEMSFTDFEIMVFLYEERRKTSDVAILLSVSSRSASVYLARLRKKKYIESERGVYASHWLTAKGLKVLSDLRTRIE